MNQTADEKPSLYMFWGCFIALITTAFAFITRAFLVNTKEMWPTDFGLNDVQSQELFGAGLWPFAISIILFSLVIDKIGYRVAMVFSFVCYAIYAALALYAYSIVNPSVELSGAALTAAQGKGLNLLTLGSIILGLGNGTVEAFINPVVATMFRRDKTKWLNILHAGWPGGLVLGGLITLGLGDQAKEDWRLLIYIIALPAFIYLLMLFAARFPVSERVSGGATYKDMLAEFGAIGAAIAGFLIIKQLAMVIKLDENESVGQYANYIVYGLVGLLFLCYGVYCKSLGRPLMILLCLIMMPLATTELGTDGAITGIMEEPMKAKGYSPLWVLIYTSAVMMVLRFFAGPVIKALTPLGLLATCAALAIAGLYWLSIAQDFIAIFAAATLYGVAKTYFWPTMLGVVSEQFPKGGALTLNAIAGIGMLTVGILGSPLIGRMQASLEVAALQKDLPALAESVVKTDKYFLGDYQAIDPTKVTALAEGEKATVEKITKNSKQGALARVTVFPAFMLLCYLGLIFYFKSKGGYKPSELASGSGH